MQRAVYGQSPPLHHPVPQHVSTVPQLRSPPPPTSSQPQPQTYASSPYPGQQQPTPQGFRSGGGGGGGPAGPGIAAAGAPPHMFAQYGQFINDPAAQVAAQLSQTALRQGQEYVEQNLHRYVNVSALKHYFNVSNAYVLNKVLLVLFPWRHKPWSRKQTTVAPAGVGVGGGFGVGGGQEGWYLPPRDDLNSPDMYIPVMSVVTYILLSTLVAGLRGQFQPELLGYTATVALAVVGLEILGLKLGCYLLSISNTSQLLDLVAYSGYKFVGVIVTIAVAELVNGGRGTGGWAGWTLFVYTFLANSLFLMRSLKYVLLPENASGRGMQTDSRAKRNQRTQFLFFYSYGVQLLFMWILTRD